MLAKDSIIHTGGLMRCCIDTVIDFVDANQDFELQEGFVLDCKYEPADNQTVIFKDGYWKFNVERSETAEA